MAIIMGRRWSLEAGLDSHRHEHLRRIALLSRSTTGGTEIKGEYHRERLREALLDAPVLAIVFLIARKAQIGTRGTQGARASCLRDLWGALGPLHPGSPRSQEVVFT